MANEWPINESVDWDDAISDNLTTGGSHNSSTGLHGLGVLSGFKTITFTRDMTAASGDVEYVTVGFQPRQVVFFASVASIETGSWGVDDGSIAKALRQRNAGNMDVDVGSSIRLVTASDVFQEAFISTLASTGFTLTWVKNGSPAAGAATIIALCFI